MFKYKFSGNNEIYGTTKIFGVSAPKRPPCIQAWACRNNYFPGKVKVHFSA